MEEAKETKYLFVVRFFGASIMVIGLLVALSFGRNQGFTASTEAAVAYIGGFILAFIGAFLAFIYGRKRMRDRIEP
jgi:hypothetical protein